MAAITLDQVSKVYPNGHHAVRDLTLEIADGELLVSSGRRAAARARCCA